MCVVCVCVCVCVSLCVYVSQLGVSTELKCHLECAGIDKIPAPNYGAIMGGIQALHLTYQSLREVRDYQTPKVIVSFVINPKP